MKHRWTTLLWELWAAWALLAEPPDGLPPEQLLEQAPGFDFATLCDFERPAAVP